MESKSPKEWIALVNSGLSGMDNYNYVAEIETGIQDDIKLQSFYVNGEVKSHHQYTMSGDEVDSTLLHPAKYLDIICHDANEVDYAEQGIDANAVSMHMKFVIKENSEEATERWKTLLWQQFTQLQLSTEHYKDELDEKKLGAIKNVLHTSEIEMKQMLNSLYVDSKFELMIDPIHALPTSIYEAATLHYVKDNKQISEYRHANVKLEY